MKRSHAANVLVASAATMIWLAVPASAASGFGGNAPAESKPAHAASVLAVNSAAAAARCWTDHDRDDRTGRPTDRDGDESARCHAHAHTHASRGDGDHDGDDVSPSRCFTDRDRDDRTGRPTDRDGDESCR